MPDLTFSMKLEWAGTPTQLTLVQTGLLFISPVRHHKAGSPKNKNNLGINLAKDV